MKPIPILTRIGLSLILTLSLLYVGSLLLAGLLSPLALAQAPLVAFPGAEGFGANATGGRGGRVIEVTNLKDTGPGSLRAAIEASGPRIVVFRVGGIIDVGAKLKIENPFITIAGQTAPGGGILLRGQKFYVAADHVIIRHVRFRLGPVSGKDAVAITNGARNVIIDHCSVSWGSDETLSVDTNASDITIQWGIISEGLNFEDHPYGSLIASGARRVTFHHNIWAHFRERSPKLGGQASDDNRYQLVNNVVYDWGNYGTACAIHGQCM